MGLTLNIVTHLKLVAFPMNRNDNFKNMSYQKQITVTPKITQLYILSGL